MSASILDVLLKTPTNCYQAGCTASKIQTEVLVKYKHLFMRSFIEEDRNFGQMVPNMAQTFILTINKQVKFVSLNNSFEEFYPFKF